MTNTMLFWWIRKLMASSVFAVWAGMVAFFAVVYAGLAFAPHVIGATFAIAAFFLVLWAIADSYVQTRR